MDSVAFLTTHREPAEHLSEHSPSIESFHENLPFELDLRQPTRPLVKAQVPLPRLSAV